MTFTSIIKVDVKRAAGLKDADGFGKSDPYVQIKFGDHEAHPHKSHTKTIRGNLNPVWDESFYFLVKDDCKSFAVDVYDKDPLKDDKLGHLTLERHHRNDKTHGGMLELQHGKGELEIYYKEFSLPEGVSGVDQLKSEGLQLLRVKVLGAEGLKTHLLDKTDGYARLSFGEGHRGEHVRTKTVKNNTSPVWDETLEVCVPASMSSFRVEVMDDDLVKDDHIGYVDVELRESRVGAQQYQLTGQGTIELSYEKVDLASLFEHEHHFHLF
eukprot:TRINITY_DN281_c0_g1_i1.p1 TRINITY_DN281_c0_g1~~TRINITY_DN281_c0_g1_i1.p1  ORF type:complete len:268 (+),score=70.17 TRINITY_DN281_c0_g1_i1:104-907(+)